MNLAKQCEEGRIGIDEFIQFALCKRPMRTHVLKEGDYVVMPDPLPRAQLLIEQVARIDYPEPGDFQTDKGTTGPISGNVFVKLNSPSIYPLPALLEGDRMDRGRGSVYDSVNRYLERTRRLN